MIAFKKIRWRNFLSTGNSFTEVILNKSNTTLIVGSNGAGKSTILDALTFSLFGKSFRNINKPSLCNSINQKNCLVEIEFDVGSTEYKVIRGIKPNVFEIYCNNNLLNQDAAAKDYQKFLEQQILRLNYKTFTQVVILGSASFVPFMQLPAWQRREVIEDILDISIFSTMNAVLKERIVETKDMLSSIDAKISIAKNKVEAQKKLINSMLESKQEQVDKILKQIEENHNEIEKNQEIYHDLSSKLESLHKKCNENEKLKSDLLKAKKTRDKISLKNDHILESLQFFEENSVCPSCSQQIEEQHKDKMIKCFHEQRDANTKNLETIQKAYDTLISKENELNKLTSEILTLGSQCNSIISANDVLMKQNKKLSTEIESTKLDTSNIDFEKQSLKNIADEALSLIENRNELSKEKAIQEAANLLLKDTGIKTAIIKEYLPVMNKLINNYLSAMDFYVHFELDESFNEVIKSRYRDEFAYASFSEGEKMRIDLAILFTWRQIAKMKNSVNTNLLILDEIFDSSLDNSGTDYFLSIMNAIGDNTNVFVISHKGDQLFDKFHSAIRFEKKNNFSEIV